MAQYRFALRPKWIVSHLLVLALVVTMVNLGFWQLRRLHEKQRFNSRVAARSAERAEPLGNVLGAGTSFDDGRAAEFRRVTATGRYRPDQQLLVRSRSLDGAPGSWVMVPLEMADGTAVVVNRGWISNEGRFEAVPPAFDPPAGEVTVTGLVRATETRGSFGPKDPPSGRLANLARADIARFQRQVPERLAPAWVQLQTERPRSSGSSPRPVPAPQLNEGPHFGYATQWFVFSAIAAGGYPLILRRRARELAAEATGPSERLDLPDPHDVPEAGDPRLDPLPGAAGGRATDDG